jgi:hypothetical protein
MLDRRNKINLVAAILGLVVSLLVVVNGISHADDPTIIMKAGADYRATLTWSAAGKAMNLTGYSYAAQFRTAPAPAGTLLANYSTVVSDAGKGQMQIRLSRRWTSQLSGKAGVWDLRQTDPSGNVTYQLGGAAKVLPVVTQ